MDTASLKSSTSRIVTAGMQYASMLRDALASASPQPAAPEPRLRGYLSNRGNIRKHGSYGRIIRHEVVGDRVFSLHATKGWRSRRI